MEALKDLELLIHSRYPIVAVRTHEEDRLDEIVRRLAARLHLRLHVWTLTDGLRLAGSSAVVAETHDAGRALAHVATLGGEAIYLFKDLHRLLDDGRVVRRLRDLVKPFSRDRRTLLMPAPRWVLPSELERHAVVFELETPSVKELRFAARKLLKDLSREHRFRIDLTSQQFDELIDSLKGLTLFEAERVMTRALLDDLALSLEDLDAVVKTKKELFDAHGIVEYLPPETGLEDIGGLASLKRWLARRANAFEPQARRFGLSPPKGVLLVGVPGCGKSLAAKAVARVWGLPLLRLEVGRLYEKYVGETERNLEDALRLSERLAPSVLMVDEIEKAFSTGGGTADAGLSRRVLGYFLSWLQDRNSPVFVVATCNQIAELPPELLRKGRFDEIFFVDLPDSDDRKAIFSLHLKKRERDPSKFDLETMAGATDGFSGAEIEEAVVSALYTAFSRETELTTGLVLEEIRATRSLSVTRREEIDALRAWAEERAVRAN